MIFSRFSEALKKRQSGRFTWSGAQLYHIPKDKDIVFRMLLQTSYDPIDLSLFTQIISSEFPDGQYINN
jgi:hypothetical protein